jgi:hypothetical protein
MAKSVLRTHAEDANGSLVQIHDRPLTCDRDQGIYPRRAVRGLAGHAWRVWVKGTMEGAIQTGL